MIYNLMKQLVSKNDYDTMTSLYPELKTTNIATYATFVCKVTEANQLLLDELFSFAEESGAYLDELYYTPVIDIVNAADTITCLIALGRVSKDDHDAYQERLFNTIEHTESIKDKFLKRVVKDFSTAVIRVFESDGTDNTAVAQTLCYVPEGNNNEE